MAERVLLQVLGLVFVLAVILITACSTSTTVRRVRFEEDRVSCYVVYQGISCVRDSSP